MTTLALDRAGSRTSPSGRASSPAARAPRDELIRLALGPDGEVAPDVRARAPGRGAWIGVDARRARRGQRQGQAQGRARSARSRPTTSAFPPTLASGPRQALRQAALDRLGMEARAGNLINGSDRIETAARAGKVHAADPRRRRQRGRPPQARPGLARRRRRGPQGVIFPDGRTILSMALGRENVVHVALTDPAAASRVRHALARWRAFTGPDRGLEGGEPALRTGSAEEDLTKE